MDYIIYDDIQDLDQYQDRPLMLASPRQQRLGVLLSRAIDDFIEKLHSSARVVLEQIGAVAQLRQIELDVLHGKYSSIEEFSTMFEKLLVGWSANWKQCDSSDILDQVGRQFSDIISTVVAPTSGKDLKSDQEKIVGSPQQMSSDQLAALKSFFRYRRSQEALPFPDRDSLADLASVVQQNYPIGDGFTYNDSQPLIPGLKQPNRLPQRSMPQQSSWEGVSRRSNSVQCISKLCSGYALQNSSDESLDLFDSNFGPIPEVIARSMLVKAVAVEIGCGGFAEMHNQTLDVMVDLTIERIREWGSRLSVGGSAFKMGLVADVAPSKLKEFFLERSSSIENANPPSDPQLGNIASIDVKRQRLY